MRLINLIIITFLSLFIQSCQSTSSSKKNAPILKKHHISSQIDTIIKTIDPNVNVGIRFVSLDDGKTLYETNAHRHFVPGSTLKLITIATALHYLGPSYRFRTGIYANSPIDAKGAVQDLYIKGSGDPSLMDTDIISLVHELKQMGLHHVLGNIYFDDQIFDDVLWGKGAMWDDRNRGYSAPVAGLNLNYNRLLIKTLPSAAAKTAITIVKPAVSYADVVAKALTKNGSKNQQISLSIERQKNPEHDWPKENNDGLHMKDKVIINGHIGSLAGPHYSSVAINDPALLVGIFLKDELARLGVKIKGSVKRQITPAHAVSLAVHESRSLAEALVDFTKISNNLGNDALLKAIAANNGSVPASSAEGLRLVNQFLQSEVGIDPSALITADGAGLSRYNLITPDQLVKLLTYAANHFHLGPEFIASLPIGGQDGLLRNRLTDELLRKNVRAKTGSFTGVTSLAGYLKGLDNKQYAFAIMINGFIGPVSKYNAMQDQILTTLLVDQEQPLAKK